MGIEQKINYQLNKFPIVKRVIKRVYQIGMYVVSHKIKSEGDIIRVSPDDTEYEYFFGYYDKSPWDITDRYMLCMRAKNTWSEVSPKETADILIIDTQRLESDPNRVKKIAETKAWNVQQACMLQWLGPDFRSKIIYNDFRDGIYCSVILSLKTMKETVISAPVYTVSADGRFALTLDFSRLYNLRPGYGYYNVPEKTKGIGLPDATAVWKINLDTGEVIELLKYIDFDRFEPREEMLEEGSVHKVNHLMINPNGKRFMVLYRWFNGHRKYTRLITCDTDGTDMFVLSDDDMVSHCCWKNNSTILAFENKKKTGPGYYLMKDKTQKYMHCWPQISNDGHPSYNPDRSFIVTDSYPDRSRIARIKIMDGDERKKGCTTITKVFAPFKYDNDTRCDLHPRWNHKGDMICFDSVFEGHRGVYVQKINKEKGSCSKEQTVLVSCIIPTHNREDLLPRAIRSVQKQTYKNLEIIVVSDGSIDGTSNLMKEFCEEDERIRFLEYHPEKGGNIARNTGIQEAKGEIVAFLDDDDEWMPEKIEKQLEVMKDTSIGLVYTGVRIVYVNERIEYSFIGKEKGDLSKTIFLDNCIGTTSTVMVRKALLEQAGLFDVNLNALQDFDLWIRICQITKVGLIQEELIRYYNFTGAKQVSAITKRYIDAFVYINNKYKENLMNISKEYKQKKLQNEYMLLANKAMRNSDGKLARYYLEKSIHTKKSIKTILLYILSFTNYKFILKVRNYF